MVCKCGTEIDNCRRIGIIMRSDEIINKLVNRRLHLSVTQKHLAQLSGVSLRAINKIENKQSSPTINTLEKLSDVLGLELRLEIKKVL